MLQLSEQYACGQAKLRVNIHGSQPIEHLLTEMTYLNYRLASVQVSSEITEANPGIVWYQDAPVKDIRYTDGVLVLEGAWHQGEIQKVVVSMLAQRMELVGLHPFHSSAIHYRGRTILFLGGEENHGKSMSQIEGSHRGGLVVSTETTVTDDDGCAVMGSKAVFLRVRAKGTERADKPDQDEGVAKFFDEVPEFVNLDEPTNVDLLILPAIDGNFATHTAELSQFEKEYQTYHSLMNYLGLHQILAPGLPMPIVDTDDLRRRRADFCHRFCRRPGYIVRAKNP
ncbi:MAG: hypothetical protein EHM56_08115, partial [Chloroflexi bacterium]